jgi:uncharacterized membrane protein
MTRSELPITGRSFAQRDSHRWLWTAVILLTLIGLAAATRRAVVLIHPTSATQSTTAKNPAAQLDGGFLQNRLRTFAHIVPAAIYLLLLPLQFIRRIRTRYPRFHRWNGRILVALGIVVVISALALSRTNSIGGVNEAAATTLYALLLLWFLVAGFRSARRRDFTTHRQWMLRAYGVTLGIATTRPIVGIFFATRKLSPHEFFGTAFWLGFTLTLMAAEVRLHTTRASVMEDRRV